MQTLFKQLKAMGFADAHQGLEQHLHLKDLPSFAMYAHATTINKEPALFIPSISRKGHEDYRLDSYQLGRIMVPDKTIAGINTAVLEQRVKSVDWMKPYRDYSLENRAKIDRIWNDYWLLAKEPAGKDAQARLFLKFWKDTEMGSGAPSTGLEPADFMTFYRFPVTDNLSFTAIEAFNLLGGQELKKITNNSKETGKEQWFVLLGNDEPLGAKMLLFQFQDGYSGRSDPNGKQAGKITYGYDEFLNRRALSADEQVKWTSKIPNREKLINSDIFQELLPAMAQRRQSR